MTFSVFYHVAILPYWRGSYDIAREYIENSGIKNNCDEFLYCINGDINEAQNYIKITDRIKEKILHINADCTKFEFPTINFLHNYLANKNTKAFYMHTKGASTEDPGYMKYWLDTMCHFNILHYKKAIELLNEYDAVGSGYTTNPWPHFSGNFWWTKSSHVKNLIPLKNNFENFPHSPAFGERHDAERWIGSAPGKFYSLGTDYIESKYFPQFKQWQAKTA